MGFPTGSHRASRRHANQGHLTVTEAGLDRLHALVKDRNAPQKHVWRAQIVLGAPRGSARTGSCARPARRKPALSLWQERFAAEPVDGLLRDKTRPRTCRNSCLGSRARRRTDDGAAPRRDDALDQCGDGEGCEGQRFLRSAHLARAWASAASCPAVQAFERLGVRRQTARHGRALCRSTGARRRAQPSTRRVESRRSTDATGAADQKGHAGTMTHDYVRNGTTTLFAALNVLDGTVIGQNMQRHRHQEFIRFLNAIERKVPVGKVVPGCSTTTPPTSIQPCGRGWRVIRAGCSTSRRLRLLAQRRRGLLRYLDQASSEARRLSVRR